nr:uncharacterized protein LOC127483744 [Oryctolagus cuniculus]
MQKETFLNEMSLLIYAPKTAALPLPTIGGHSEKTSVMIQERGLHQAEPAGTFILDLPGSRTVTNTFLLLTTFDQKEVLGFGKGYSSSGLPHGDPPWLERLWRVRARWGEAEKRPSGGHWRLLVAELKSSAFPARRLRKLPAVDGGVNWETLPLCLRPPAELAARGSVDRWEAHWTLARSRPTGAQGDAGGPGASPGDLRLSCWPCRASRYSCSLLKLVLGAANQAREELKHPHHHPQAQPQPVVVETDPSAPSSQPGSPDRQAEMVQSITPPPSSAATIAFKPAIQNPNLPTSLPVNLQNVQPVRYNRATATWRKATNTPAIILAAQKFIQSLI